MCTIRNTGGMRTVEHDTMRPVITRLNPKLSSGHVPRRDKDPAHESGGACWQRSLRLNFGSLRARVERQSKTKRLLSRRALSPLQGLGNFPGRRSLARERLQLTNLFCGPGASLSCVFHANLHLGRMLVALSLSKEKPRRWRDCPQLGDATKRL